jgi:peptide/nickel transport system ATP-binding protein
MSEDIVLDVRDLHTHFYLRRGIIKVVDGISFSLRRKEVLGLVGESGCGKSMTALSLLRLIPRPAARTVKGEIVLDGEEILAKSSREMQHIRGSKIAMILQDPQTSLNPVFTIGNQLRESIVRQHQNSKASITERIVDALRQVKVAAPETRIHLYLH